MGAHLLSIYNCKSSNIAYIFSPLSIALLFWNYICNTSFFITCNPDIQRVVYFRRVHVVAAVSFIVNIVAVGQLPVFNSYVNFE